MIIDSYIGYIKSKGSYAMFIGRFANTKFICLRFVAIGIGGDIRFHSCCLGAAFCGLNSKALRYHKLVTELVVCE